jgi:hypothetical protein
MVRGSVITAFALVGAFAAVPASAAFTTVNLDAYVNGSVNINPDQLPIGTSTGNQGTNILFDVSANPQNADYSGVWLSPGGNASLTVDLAGLGISGQASFYALLNNYYGTPNSDEYDITISSATQSVTYQSIGGVDTRDYNSNHFTNDIAATTTEWYDNGIGQRYDVRTFTLPTAFASDTITSFTITQVNGSDNAVFAGLTFSTLAAGVTSAPEPGTWAMFVGGFGLVGGAMRRRSPARVRFA